MAGAWTRSSTQHTAPSKPLGEPGDMGGSSAASHSPPASSSGTWTGALPKESTSLPCCSFTSTRGAQHTVNSQSLLGIHRIPSQGTSPDLSSWSQAASSAAPGFQVTFRKHCIFHGVLLPEENKHTQARARYDPHPPHSLLLSKAPRHCNRHRVWWSPH